MRVLRTREYSEIVLYVIYRNAMIDGATISDEKSILEGLGELANPPQLRLALNSILERGLARDPFKQDRPFHDTQYFTITEHGIDLVEQRLREEPESAAAIFRDGNFEAFYEDWIDVTVNFDQDVPAADRLVSIDHNRPEHAEIAEALDKAIEIAMETRPNEVSGDEHRSIVAGLEAARALWEAFELTRIQVQIGILMAVQRAEDTLKRSFELVKGPLLMEAIKAFFKSMKGGDFF